jgi:integrase
MRIAELELFHGRCPACARRARRTPRPQVISFGAVAAQYLAAHRASWRSAEHARQWDTAFKAQAKTIWDMPVAAVDTAAVMSVLQPLWTVKTQTAFRLKGRIESVLDFAKARGWRTSENPARWRGHLSELLASPKKLAPVRHLAALDWRELPALWTDLTQRADMAALLLRLLFATTLRRDEARLGRWVEVDLPAKVWTVPAVRMKSGLPHRVPLSDAALDVLKALAARRRDDWLFPGANTGRPLGATAMREMLGLLRSGATTHGSTRAGFVGWATAHGVSLDLREAALAHVIPDKVRAAYQREDLLNERAPIMQRWGKFLTSPVTAGEVVPLHEGQVAA